MSQLDDLIERLKRAESELISMSHRTDPFGVKYIDPRLKGKAEGVRLALSYARECLRGDR